MKKINLMLHCGGKHTTREELADSRTPAATDSWHPIPHIDLLNNVGETLQRTGLSILAEEHGLSREGARYFGLLQVANGQNPDDYSMIVGVRNSHDKSFPAALVMGAGVFVCDNLSFSGEVKLARRHTRNILRDLPGLVDRGVGLLGDHRRHQDKRIAAYKEHEIVDVQAHDLIINALDAGIVSKLLIPDVLNQWRSPNHDEFAPRTAWSLFNAFTECFKGSAALSLPRTQKLHGLMDSVCGLITATV